LQQEDFLARHFTEIVPQEGAESRHSKPFAGMGEGVEVIPAPRRQRAAGLRVCSDAEADYEHQYPNEYGKTWPQVLELGLVVVPQALHFQ
jgi:hypothetical protein